MKQDLLNEADVIILRGLPGAGKTTWVKDRFKYKPHTVCSADDHFVSTDGSYRFDPKKLSKAHGECLQRFVITLERGRAYDLPLVVDNTNLFALDMAPYVELAKAYEKKWCILTIHAPFDLAFSRNIHGVEEATFRKKIDYITNERLPSFWLQNHVEIGLKPYAMSMPKE